MQRSNLTKVQNVYVWFDFKWFVNNPVRRDLIRQLACTSTVQS